ncbi:MAG: extracellular solute-binding protein [Candidatus Shapirobacteria bacterium]|nr:extracellular solute-binding protein [Candidatus Shapirobacteria bacterium]
MENNDVQSPLPPRRVTVEETVVTEPAEVSTPVAEPIKTKPKFPVKILGIVGVVVLLVVLGIVVMNLIKGGGGTGKPKTLTYWGLWEDSAILEGIIADFEAKNPGIKITYISNQKEDYRTRLAGRLAKDPNSGDVPDIFRIHSSWWPMFSDQLAMVPEKTATNIGLNTDYYDVFKNTLKQKGQFWGIPLMYDGLAMFYNKDLLESASVQVPKSWEDLRSAANRLTVRDDSGQIKISGAALGLVDNVDQWSDILGLMMLQGGVDPLASDAANIKKLQDVLTFYTLFYTKDKVWDESLPNSTDLFASGKLAFYFGPSWRAFNINDINPKLNYEIALVPQLLTTANATSATTNEADLTNINWSTYWVEGVNKNSKNQKEAWLFLEFLSQKDNLTKLYTAAADTRAFGEIYPRVSMQQMMTQNSKTAPFVNGANTANQWYLASRTFDGTGGVDDGMIKYFGDAINSITVKNMTADSVMTDLRNGIDQLKTKFKL